MEDTKVAGTCGRDTPVVANQRGGRNFKEFSLYRDLVKRLFDLVLALAILPLVLPVFAVLYLLVRRDGGSFLYKHPRIGLGGKTFDCLKIRTMVVDSETILKDVLDQNPDARKEWNENFKLRNDPRITPIGKSLRKTSLDELPQIFNVLLGDMSVVGPRPITSEELGLYGDAAEDYKRVNPGLTGPWQVTGRRENDFKSRVALDTAYVKNVSFFTDIYYILATVPEVVFARGR